MNSFSIILILHVIAMNACLDASIPFSGNAQMEAFRQQVYDDEFERRIRASYIKSIKRYLSADLSLNLSQDEARILIADLSASQKVAEELFLTQRQLKEHHQTLERNHQTLIDLQEQIEEKNEEIMAMQRSSSKLSGEFSRLLLMKENELAQTKLHKVNIEKSLKQKILEQAGMQAFNYQLQNEKYQLQLDVSKAEQDIIFYRRTATIFGVGVAVVSAIAAKLYFGQKK